MSFAGRASKGCLATGEPSNLIGERMNYAVEYTPNENEGSQLEYIDRGTFEMVMLKNDPSCMFTDEDGTRVVTDEAGAYYA